MPDEVSGTAHFDYNRTRRPDRREPRLGTTFNTGCLQWSVSPVLCGPGDGEQGVAGLGHAAVSRVIERDPAFAPVLFVQPVSRSQVMPRARQPNAVAGDYSP